MDTAPHFELFPAYPDPFNAATTLHYSLPRADHVSLLVYDIISRRVDQLMDKNQSAGVYSVHWEPQLASGIYFVRYSAGSTEHIQKVMLIK